jgi:hypothetical protein
MQIFKIIIILLWVIYSGLVIISLFYGLYTLPTVSAINLPKSIDINLFGLKLWSFDYEESLDYKKFKHVFIWLHIICLFAFLIMFSTVYWVVYIISIIIHLI